MQNPLSRLSTALARSGQGINEKRPSPMGFFLPNNATEHSVYFSSSQLKNRHWLLTAIAQRLHYSPGHALGPGQELPGATEDR